MNWFPSDQLGLAYVSITSRPMSVGMRPTLNCRPLPLAVGTFKVTYRCGTSTGIGVAAPAKSPFDWMTVASWPTSNSVWNPALNFAGSYGLSSTAASALSVNRFWNRSYSRPTIVVSARLWPEYAYDPAANPVSLNPAIVVSRWLTGGAGGSGGLVAAVSLGAEDAPCAYSTPGATIQRARNTAVAVMSFIPILPVMVPRVPPLRRAERGTGG